MLQQIVKNIADNKNKESLSHQYRTKRFELFKTLLNGLPKPVSILDIGGTVEFWKAMCFEDAAVRITLLNLEPAPKVDPPFYTIQGNATNLSGIADGSYDIVFSNSVIEHLFTWENQQKMAAEVHRVGKNHFIQTPNYWFPIEPHWVFPFFQYFPKFLRQWLTQHFHLGHIGKASNSAAAKRQVEEIRLLTKAEMKQLFPHSTLYKEQFKGLNKSFTAYSFDGIAL